MTVPATGEAEKLSTVIWSPFSRRWTMTSIALLDTAGTSSWVAVAMPYFARTARMSRSPLMNDASSASWSGSAP